MARTNAALVGGVLLGDLDPFADLTPFIESASVIVDSVSAKAAGSDTPLTEAELELIERWLSAHSYAMSDQPYSSKSTGGASASFQGQTGKYLEATKYGQMAVTLDRSGTLRMMGQSTAAGGGTELSRSAGGFWLGRTPDEQTPYWER
jgi:hypothetical protein